MPNLVLFSKSKKSSGIEHSYSHRENIYEKFEGIIDFSENISEYFNSDIIIYESFFAYSTEMNYKRVLANFFINLNPCCQITIIERQDDPKLSLLFRSLRCLDYDKFVDIKISNGLIKINFRKEFFDLIKWTLPFSELIPSIEDSRAISNICSAIKSHKKISLVRVGHCEVKFIANEYFYGPTDLKQTYQIQWGADAISDTDFSFVKIGLIAAIKNADILGFNARTQPSPEPLRILENSISKAILDFSLFNEKQTRVRPNIHWEIGLSREFIDSLKHATRVVIISSRGELKSIFHKILSPTEVIFLEIPGEHKIDGLVDLNYRFNRFIEIDQAIPSLTKKGAVFLIGAGVAGKRFCATVSNLDCTALDLGSTLDAWAGVNSRGSGFHGKYQKFLENISFD